MRDRQEKKKEKKRRVGNAALAARKQGPEASQLSSCLHVGATDAGGWISGLRREDVFCGSIATISISATHPVCALFGVGLSGPVELAEA